ncbi:MAG: hypothetical protein AB7H92_17120 [Microbacteriaceae bacterium]
MVWRCRLGRYVTPICFGFFLFSELSAPLPLGVPIWLLTARFYLRRNPSLVRATSKELELEILPFGLWRITVPRERVRVRKLNLGRGIQVWAVDDEQMPAGRKAFFGSSFPIRNDRLLERLDALGYRLVQP